VGFAFATILFSREQTRPFLGGVGAKRFEGNCVEFVTLVEAAGVGPPHGIEAVKVLVPGNARSRRIATIATPIYVKLTRMRTHPENLWLFGRSPSLDLTGAVKTAPSPLFKRVASHPHRVRSPYHLGRFASIDHGE
jgi:hypothetical protein